MVHRIDDPEDWNSDYPRCYCEVCWDIGAPFRDEYYKLRDKYDAESDAIMQKWKEACTEKK